MYLMWSYILQSIRTALQGCRNLFHFIDEEIKNQRGLVICLRQRFAPFFHLIAHKLITKILQHTKKIYFLLL